MLGRNNNYHSKYLLLDAKKNRGANVINRIEKYNLQVNSNEFLDDSNQNLLHLAAHCGDTKLATFLMTKNINTEKRNCFDQKPIDIAIKNNDIEMTKIILSHPLNNELKDIKYKLEIAEDDINLLTIKNQSLNEMISNLNYQVKLGKRKEREWNVIENENKKYKTDNYHLTQENIKLKKDNTILKNTVKTLRNQHRK